MSDKSLKKTVPAHISKEIGLRIAKGLLHPNEHLVEASIAEEFKTSRAPVREALLMLEKDGLVTRLPHRGFVVRKFTNEEFHQMYDATFRLEEIAVIKAVEKLTPDNLAELEQIMAQQKIAVDSRDVVRYYELNEKFHLLIFTIAGNDFLTEMHQSLRRSSRALSMLSIGQGNNMELSYEEHAMQLKAIKSGEIDAAIRGIRMQESRSLRTLDIFY